MSIVIREVDNPFASLLPPMPKRDPQLYGIRTTNICCPLCCVDPSDCNMLIMRGGEYECPLCAFVFGMPPLPAHNREDDDA